MKRWYKWILISILLVAVYLIWSAWPRPFQLTFFDVGQGDAALIQTKAGQTILIDGGPDRKILQKLGKSLPWDKRTIDVVILSHPHADHLSGLIEVLKRYQVQQILTTGVLHTTPEYLAFLQLIKDKHIPIQTVQAGQVFNLAGDVKIDILWPNFSLVGQRFEDLNTTSIVNKVTFGKTTVLFMGDSPIDSEHALLQAGLDVRAQILKVGHHGSRNSSSEEFVKDVSPQMAIISVGEGNSFGHPHSDVVNKLTGLVPKVFRTDKDGDVNFVSDGDKWIGK